ncbi:MAG: hypothetical protein R2865_04300 [Deinococcales bacterium]
MSNSTLSNPVTNRADNKSHGLITPLDLDFVRAQFPAFSHPNNQGTVFCENAGGSFVSQFVLNKHANYMCNMRVQPYANYQPSKAAGEAMDLSYERMANFTGEALMKFCLEASTSMNTCYSC